MNESILNSVKKIGLGVDYLITDFDPDIIMHTNTVLAILNQMGFGKEGFYITGTSEKWSDFILTDEEHLHYIKSWVSLKVRMLFDPPTSSILAEAIKDNLKELEWRIYINKNYVREYEDSLGTSEYKTVSRLQDFLYTIDYDNLDYNYAKQYFLERRPIPVAGCSSIRKGNLFGRNFDWQYDNNAEFVVRTKGTKGLYSTIGVAGQLADLTNDFVASGKNSEAYKILPFFLTDGINEKGVVCNINVVPKQKGSTIGTIPTEGLADSFCYLMLPRYILDHFSTASAACNWIRSYASLFAPKGLQDLDYEAHFMVADLNNTYCIEFVNNITKVIDITDKPYMTNFFIDGVTFNQDGSVYTPKDVTESGVVPTIANDVTSRGSGLERYNLINASYSSISDFDSMHDLMSDLAYTKSYKLRTNPFWYTEFVGIDNMTIDNSESEFMEKAVPQAIAKFKSRSRDTAKTWQTTHCSIYDITNKKLVLNVQENFDTNYEFKL